MSNWLEFGTVGRPHGVRGELTLWPENLASNNRNAIKNVIISKNSRYEDGQPYKVVSIKPGKDHWLMTLEGLDNREAAALLTNYHLFVDRDELTPCAEGEIYLADIIGFEVLDTICGQSLGHFTAVIDFPQGIYLEITREEEGRRGTLELPWVVDFVEKIDYEKRQLILSLPEGLTELTQWK